MQNSMSKKIVAITGGIGSGKSTLLKFLSTSGFTTVSCDKVYSDIIKTRSYKKKLKALFPDCVKGRVFLSVDKKALSEKVFNSKDSLIKLNALVHPLIMERALKIANKGDTALAFIEVPLLFEGDFQNLFHHVIVVKRNLKDRIDSVINRSNLTEKEVLDRIANQIDYDTFDFNGYYLVENNGTEREFREKVSSVIKQIREQN